MILAAAVMSGCSDDTQRLGAVRPTITLTARSLADFEQAGPRAEHLCRSHYGRGALLLQTHQGPAADTLTFACVGEQ
jgi:hypothetical protein